MTGMITRKFAFAAYLASTVLFLTAISSYAQGDCSCVPNQVILQLSSSANLAAVAAQYGLNPAPLSQVASPAIYLLQITNGQTPTQVVSAMAGDARIIFREVNRKLSQVEREGLPWTQGRSWAIGQVCVVVLRLSRRRFSQPASRSVLPSPYPSLSATPKVSINVT